MQLCRRFMTLVPALCLAAPLAAAPTKTPAPPGAPPSRSAETPLQRLLAQLRSSNPLTRKIAADRLKVTPVGKDRERVASALVDTLNDSDLLVRWSSVTALGVWATPSSVPALIRMLDDSEHAVRWAAMDSLARIKDPRAADALARMVERGRDRGMASAALRAHGPIAIPCALRLLSAAAWEAKMEGVRILAAVGGPESVAPLQELQEKDDGLIRMYADEALQKIAARIEE